MKFILFVEGHTEMALPEFLKKWLDIRLPSPIGIKSVRFEGLHDYHEGIAKRVELGLSGKSGIDVIAAVGLIDLYGPTFYPANKRTPDDRYTWAKEYFERKVSNSKFHQHFAVHETEAWLLAHPEILPLQIKTALATKSLNPEAVNFNEPPGKLLGRLYREKLGKTYKKVTDGANLFRSLSPDRAYERCPALKALLDDMLSLAQEALR